MIRRRKGQSDGLPAPLQAARRQARAGRLCRRAPRSAGHTVARNQCARPQGGTVVGAARDPFDRMLAAQFAPEKLPLVSCDPAMAQFRVEVLW